MKRAIVVGASSGIGKATALKLANSGWDVIVHGFRKSAETHALAEQIQSLGRRSHALIADLSQTAQVQNLVEQAWSGMAWTPGSTSPEPTSSPAMHAMPILTKSSKCSGQWMFRPPSPPAALWVRR